MSAIEKLEQRVKALEAEVAQLKQRPTGDSESKNTWVDKIYGTFADDPDYVEAMRLGRKYRESTRPKRKKKKPTNAR